MKKISFLFYCFFFLLNFVVSAQKIKGIITNENGAERIAYATIFINATQKTISNENGEFELQVEKLPTEIAISHISYQPIKIKVIDEGILNIKLKNTTQTLNEVTIGNYGLTIMRNAYSKAKDYVEESNYSKAFFRQVAYEAEKPTYLNEIYFNADWKNYGLLKWSPIESRYLRSNGAISYTNLSFSVLLLSGYLSNSIFLKPLSSQLDSLYSFKVKNTFKYGKGEIAVINCKLKVKTNKSYFEGDYYVNTESFDVLKIEGTLLNYNMTSKGILGIRLKEINLISQYKINEQGKSVLDFSSFVLKSKMTVMGMGTKTAELSNTLYIIDYKNDYNKDLRDVQGKTNDVKTAQDMPYNSQFWKDNQTIKRTSREEEAIKILEEFPQVKR